MPVDVAIRRSAVQLIFVVGLPTSDRCADSMIRSSKHVRYARLETSSSTLSGFMALCFIQSPDLILQLLVTASAHEQGSARIRLALPRREARAWLQARALEHGGSTRRGALTPDATPQLGKRRADGVPDGVY